MRLLKIDTTLRTFVNDMLGIFQKVISCIIFASNLKQKLKIRLSLKYGCHVVCMVGFTKDKNLHFRWGGVRHDLYWHWSRRSTNRPYHCFRRQLDGYQSGQKLQWLYGNPIANNSGGSRGRARAPLILCENRRND